MKVLAERLFKSAKSFAESALAAYDRGEAHVFLLHGGTALEHLLKARLAELNPALISKRDHVQSLVWFADETKHAIHPVDIRTISLDEALTLVSAMKVPINSYKDDISTLQKYRNGVAHFGVADQQVAYRVLPGLLNTLTVLALELASSRGGFFGAFDDFVGSQLAKHAQEEERDYEGRVAQARMRFAAEHGDLEPLALEHLRQLGEIRWHRRSLEEQLVECPVCELPAYAEGSLEQVDWSIDYDREGHAEHAWPVLEFQASDLRCSTCGLVLDTPGLISLSGAFENWNLPDEDYDAYMRQVADDEREWSDYY